MSLRSRARHIQQVTGLSYQQALAKLRALGEAIARMREATGLSLAECDLLLIELEIAKDGQERASTESAALLAEAAALRAAHPVEPADPIASICRQLVESSGAKAACVFDVDGTILAQTQAFETRMLALARVMTMRPLSSPPQQQRREVVLLEGEEGAVLVLPVGWRDTSWRATLMVLFDEATSLGLVRLRAEKAVEELEVHLGRRPDVKLPWGPRGGPGDSGPGGLPALAVLVVETPWWRTPRPLPPPEPLVKPGARYGTGNRYTTDKTSN